MAEVASVPVKYNPKRTKGKSLKKSYAIWGAWMGAFAALELPAAFVGGGHIPWLTLSSTTHDLVKRSSGVAAIFIVGGLAVLTVHLVSPQVFEQTLDK